MDFELIARRLQHTGTESSSKGPHRRLSYVR